MRASSIETGRSWRADAYVEKKGLSQLRRKGLVRDRYDTHRPHRLHGTSKDDLDVATIHEEPTVTE